MNPLFAYGIAGFGAAAYSPAKYGILTEYLPPEKLVLANSWMEGLTVAAIVLGAIISGILIRPDVANTLLNWLQFPLLNTSIDTAPELAILIVTSLYLLAAIFNLYIPRLPIDHRPFSNNPVSLIKEFSHCSKLLWKDPLGQVSLAVTTLFWGSGATLKFIVLAWAAIALNFDQSSAANLIACVAIGIAIGSVLAARLVKIEHSVKVLPVGIAMGFVVLAMIPVTSPGFAVLLLISIGAMGGYFVVPMNALLQHRGHLLMGSGSSIAVQNFNENLSIAVMLGLYTLMNFLNFNIYTIIFVFGILLAGIMAVLYKLHGHDQDNGRI